LREAFLLQMNESDRHFDMFLERELRQMLDPVVGAKPPARGGRLKGRPEPVLTLEPAVETVPVAVPLTVPAVPVPPL
jgi:hypothetical protein